MQLSPENRLMLACAKISPDAEQLEKLNDLIPLVSDWEKLSWKLIERGFAPLFYKKLAFLSNLELIPETVLNRLKKAYYKTLNRSMVLSEAFRSIAEKFNEHGIRFIPLKGIYLSETLYGDIGLRQFSDIDLLVKPEYAERSLLVLESLGYTSALSIASQFEGSNENIIHYSPMVSNAVSIEIHIKLMRESENCNFGLNEIWKNASPSILFQQPILRLDVYDLIIHVCLHLDKHMLAGNMQFTGFLDITNLLEKNKDTLDWNKLKERCELYNCTKVIFALIILVRNYMNVEIPAEIYFQHQNALSKNYEKLFIKYLDGYYIFLNGYSNKISSLKHFKSTKEKLRFISGTLFPPKLLIVYKYNIKKPSLVPFYYLYRYWIGVKGLVQVLVTPQTPKWGLKKDHQTSKWGLKKDPQTPKWGLRTPNCQMGAKRKNQEPRTKNQELR